MNRMKHVWERQERIRPPRRAAYGRLALLLCAALLAQMLPPAFARDEHSTGTPVENTYVLSVTTGANAGLDSAAKTGVSFFAVRYEDADGLERKSYILPCEDDLSKGVADFTKGYETVQNSVKSLSGYTVAGVEKTIPLAAYQTDEFVFTTETAVSRILGVEVFTRGQGTWTCQGLRVYKADVVFGVEMYGWYSSRYYLDFSGVLLARMEKNDSTPVGVAQNYITLNWDADRRFHIDAQPLDGDQGRLNNAIPAGEAAYNTHTQTGYFFQMGIEDTYGSGVESLVNYYAADIPSTLAQMGLYEPLTLAVQYLDVYGDIREAALPVVSSAVDWAVSQGVSSGERLLGLAQQGDTLGFAGFLPDCASLTQCTLSYGAAAAEKAASLTAPAGTVRQKRVTEQTDSKDSLVLSYFAAYDLSNCTASAVATNGVLTPMVSGKPSWYYKQDHEVLEVGRSATHRLSAWEESAALGSRNLNDSYLVRLNTDEMDAAATTGDLAITLTYTDLNGNEQTTGVYRVQEYSRDYYGLWPGSTGDVAYKAGMNSGGEMCFVITLNDVNYFTGASFSLGRTGGDDWQMNRMSVLRLSSLGGRSVAWKALGGAGWETDRTISRAYEGYEAFTVTEPILIQAGEERNVTPGGSGGSGGSSGSGGSGGSGSGVTVTERDVDWSELRNSMSYTEATRNLGFTKARKNYTVTVKVADDAVTDMKDGDCGSANHFYFQLVFENGRSGYVLANQQLASDRFRAGYDESFIISTNQNYGELVSINIIPNNLSDVADVYDKLKIDSIEVVQNASASLSRVWVVNDVGWIAIDYRDVAETSAVTGAEGRSEAELARNYPISYGAYAVNLLFELTTGSPPSTNTTMPQGSVYGMLTYRNSAGQLKTKTIDVVQAMYLYANKTGQSSSTVTFVDDEGNSAAASVSDPGYMFREGKTDRFVWAVTDVSKLISFTLTGNFQRTCYWRISALAVSTIQSEGTLRLNANNEYEFQYTTEPEILATHASESAIPYEQFFPQNSNEEIYIGLTDNSIEIKGTEETGWSTAVTRTPLSTNDTLDLVVYPADKERASAPGSYDVAAQLRYSSLTGPDYSLNAETLRWDAVEGVYYATGLSAPGMVTLNSVSLKANSRYSTLSYIDHAVVRQVRSGVVVGTYDINFYGNSIEYGADQAPSPTSALPAERQTVAFKLAPGTAATSLTAGKQDLAVAIRYTAVGDPRGREYQSPYVFLTDQEYASVTGGQMIRLSFGEHYVKEIKGLTFLAQGAVTFTVDGACVAVYQADDALCTGWYSFNGSEVVGSSPRTLAASAAKAESSGALGLLRITLTGTDGTTPLRVKVGYLNWAGIARTEEFTNLRVHALPGTDGALTADVLLSEVSELRWVSIEPHNAASGGLAGTYLGDLTLRLETGNQITSLTRAIEQTAYEQTPGSTGGPVTVNFSNVMLTIRARSQGGSKTTERTTINGTEGLLIESGESIALDVSLSGSVSGYTVNAVEVEGLSVREAGGYLTGSGNSYTFQPPKNEGASRVTYRITFTSQEVPTVSAGIEVTVDPAPQPATESAAPSSERSGDGGESSDGA